MAAEELEAGFVDESRGLERGVVPLAAHRAARGGIQVVVDRPGELFDRVRVGRRIALAPAGA
jgi:hypothetical protein